MTIRRLHHRAAATAALALTALALVAAPAAAEFDPGDVDEPPIGPAPTYVARPDVRFVSGAARATTTGWDLTYTVRNVGDAAAGSSTTTVRRDGTTALASVAEPGLGAGISRTGTVGLPRSACWEQLRVDLDSADVVVEHTNVNNRGWVVGEAQRPCAAAARYQVRVVELRAQTAQGPGADEPYIVFSAVSDGAGTTWSTPPASGVLGGEPAYIPASHRCVWGSGGECAGRPAPDGLGINAEVMEHDSGDLTKIRDTVAEAFDRAGSIGTLVLSHWVGMAAPLVDDAVDEILAWFDDDQIGANTWGYSRTELAAAVPLVGNTIRETRSFHSGDRAAGAVYQLSLQITRTA